MKKQLLNICSLEIQAKDELQTGIKTIKESIEGYLKIYEFLKNAHSADTCRHSIMKNRDLLVSSNANNQSEGKTFETIIWPILATLKNVSSDLKKFEPSILIEDKEEFLFLEKSCKHLFDSFYHLFTNSIVHGIEHPKDREKANKNPIGKIDISLRRTGDLIFIRYSDDGKGLDLVSLEQKGQEKGVLSNFSKDIDKANIVFSPYISTVENSSYLAGRGVGLSAVKNLIENMGGSVNIELMPENPDRRYRNFQIVISLPVIHLLKIAA